MNFKNLKQFVFLIVFYFKESNPEFTKVWGSKSTIGGYEAYVVNAISKSGKYIITWIFKSSDGKFRYIALEGTPETLKIYFL